MKQHKVSKQERQRKEKENHTDEQLAKELFMIAESGEASSVEFLEKLQLQSAISALSEKLLLFQNINEDKEATERLLQSHENARVDL